jgi:hypothetical protein
MNSEIKHQWITALESGNYEKGTGFLRTATNKFCCLGVLCDLYVHHVGKPYLWKDSFTESTAIAFREHHRDNAGVLVEHTGVLPDIVMEWAGLDEYDPAVYVYSNHDQTPDPELDYSVSENGDRILQDRIVYPISGVNDETPDFTKVIQLIKDQL